MQNPNQYSVRTFEARFRTLEVRQKHKNHFFIKLHLHKKNRRLGTVGKVARLRLVMATSIFFLSKGHLNMDFKFLKRFFFESMMFWCHLHPSCMLFGEMLSDEKVVFVFLSDFQSPKTASKVRIWEIQNLPQFFALVFSFQV